MSNQKVDFLKVAFNHSEHINLLKLRGLNITEHGNLPQFLQSIGYYRLSGYFFPYYISIASKRFKDGTTFSDITALYNFDRELRLIVLDAIERIEVALRATISNHMSINYGINWYINANNFSKAWCSKNSNPSQMDRFVQQIKDICNSKRTYIQHFYTKYKSPSHPPSWMIMECLSFGTLIRLWRNLRKTSDKKAIAKKFDLSASVFQTFLEPVRNIRNISAHHDRLWNQWFVYRCKWPRNWPALERHSQHRLYEQILILAAMIPNKKDRLVWLEKCKKLFYEHSFIDFTKMGFSHCWSQDPVWNILISE